MPRKARTAVALIAAAALALPAAPAGAAEVSDPLIEGLLTPLGLAVGADGTVYVAESFNGSITAVRGGRSPRTYDVGGFVTGLAAEGKGTLSFTGAGPAGVGVSRMLPNGTTRLLGDTTRVENDETNPDGDVTYGFRELDPGCEPTDGTLEPPYPGDSYPGDVNPNPYAVAIMPDGSRVVADAGGNTLIRVRPNGRVSVLAVLPPVLVPGDADFAEAFGFDPCVDGSTYALHPVPTDVELGPDGLLYVSSLAGEVSPGSGGDPVPLPWTGGVFTVHPGTGEVTDLARGFFGAVDLAVAPDGTVYVAELFGGRISRVDDAFEPATVVEVNAPGALEWANGKLYATIGAFPPAPTGQVVTITP